jgi:hypothetical protein
MMHSPANSAGMGLGTGVLSGVSGWTRAGKGRFINSEMQRYSASPPLSSGTDSSEGWDTPFSFF